MNKSFPHWITAVAIAVLLIGCKRNATVTTTATDTANCPAPASWFPSSKTPEPNNAAFPDSNTATNCDFHQWSWQMFLWLTQSAGNGDLRFMTFPTDNDLFKIPAARNLAANLTALTTPPAPLAQLPKHRPMMLRPRTTKPRVGGTELNPSEIAQAGSGAILVGPNGQIVYYSVFFDSVYYEFIRTNKYYDLANYVKASPNTDFPVGALEIKASWRVLKQSEDAGGAFTTQAMIPQLKDSAGGLYIDESKPMKQALVALIGVHVVGVVAHHPEFIWATFEHNANAPDLPYGMSTSADSAVSQSNYTFYKAGTKADSCNNQPSAYTLNAATQTVSPIAQVFREYAWGDTSATTPNTKNIVMLNQSVHNQLEAGSWLKNYSLIGAVWLLPGALHPNMAPVLSDLHGSPYLNNATMETYVQPQTGCFSCHNTQSTTTTAGDSIPAMNMNLSHILTDGLITREHLLRKLHKK